MDLLLKLLSLLEGVASGQSFPSVTPDPRSAFSQDSLWTAPILVGFGHRLLQQHLGAADKAVPGHLWDRPRWEAQPSSRQKLGGPCSLWTPGNVRAGWSCLWRGCAQSHSFKLWSWSWIWYNSIWIHFSKAFQNSLWLPLWNLPNVFRTEIASSERQGLPPRQRAHESNCAVAVCPGREHRRGLSPRSSFPEAWPGSCVLPSWQFSPTPCLYFASYTQTGLVQPSDRFHFSVKRNIQPLHSPAGLSVSVPKLRGPIPDSQTSALPLVIVFTKPWFPLEYIHSFKCYLSSICTKHCSRHLKCLSEWNKDPNPWEFPGGSTAQHPTRRFHCAWLLSCSVMSNSLRPALWTVARQAPLSMKFSRPEHWDELPFPPPGDLPNPGIKPKSLSAPTLADRFFTTEPSGKPSLWWLRFSPWN